VEGPETVYRGPVEMRRYWDDWHAVCDVTIEISEIRDLGDTALALGWVRMRGNASGIDLERPTAYVFEFDEGLARTVRAYLDPRQGLAAVGLAE
jgi:ketosteroid isomerase-like protein